MLWQEANVKWAAKYWCKAQHRRIITGKSSWRIVGARAGQAHQSDTLWACDYYRYRCDNVTVITVM